ncbi:MAG TPA: lipocalin-like domain-containing protein [Thermoanaerobaculia bacterium]|nr:lipocalin-like domain-containing protein [Thermoanaerobaculia bacterium]
MRRTIPLLALGLVAAALSALEPQSPVRPSPEPFAGTWTLLSVSNVLPDGTRVQPYGPSPQGILMFDAEGRYSLQIFRSGRAGFASNDKSRGTAEEYKATVEGTNSHFGRYSVDEASRVITFQIEHASYPNWEGTEQKRSFTRTGDELRYTVPTTTTGNGAVGEVVWSRAASD